MARGGETRKIGYASRGQVEDGMKRQHVSFLLRHAAASGNADDLMRLLENWGHIPNIVDEADEEVSEVNLFLAAFHPHALSQMGKTALMEAAEKGHLACVRVLLPVASLDQTSRVSVLYHRQRVLLLLLLFSDRTVRINELVPPCCMQFLFSALMFSAAAGHVEVLCALAEAGASLDQQEVGGWTV